MDRRRNPRVKAQLPVRIWGVDAHDLPFMQLASVKNLSSSGVVVQGMRRQIKPGEILEVQLDDEKAQFRVVWTGMQGTHGAGEIGLRRLADEPFLWGVALGCYSEIGGRGVVRPIEPTGRCRTSIHGRQRGPGGTIDSSPPLQWRVCCVRIRVP